VPAATDLAAPAEPTFDMCERCGALAAVAEIGPDGPLCVPCVDALVLAEQARLEGLAQDRYDRRGF
jgi:hypothetical protein